MGKRGTGEEGGLCDSKEGGNGRGKEAVERVWEGKDWYGEGGYWDTSYLCDVLLSSNRGNTEIEYPIDLTKTNFQQVQ